MDALLTRAYTAGLEAGRVADHTKLETGCVRIEIPGDCKFAAYAIIIGLGRVTSRYTVEMLTNEYQSLDRNRRFAEAFVEVLRAAGVAAKITVEQKTPQITCPRCGLTSYNPNDVFQEYCGHCHRFHADDMERTG